MRDLRVALRLLTKDKTAHESLGIRVALGSSRAAVFQLILREGSC